MKLNPIFSDNMILQANAPVRVFGTGKGKVKIKIEDKEQTSICNDENWSVELPSFDYGGPYTVDIYLDGEHKRLKNVYFGDVYLFAGQSNIEFKLWESTTPDEYLNENELLRLFTVEGLQNHGKRILTENGWKTIDENGNISQLQGELYRSSDGWVYTEKDTIRFWSALGYLVADYLSKNDPNKRIGVIVCYQGASVIRSWLPEHCLDSTEFDIPFNERSVDAKNPEYSCWNGDGMLYVGMLSKIIPISLKAVVWYQGESDSSGKSSETKIYSGILETLIKKWRNDFKNPELPFIVVQIHDYLQAISKDDGWRSIQQAQKTVCERTKNTYLVESSDICETDVIHPPTKLPLAKRIAQVAQKIK